MYPLAVLNGEAVPPSALLLERHTMEIQKERKPATYGRLKHLWEATVMHVPTGDKHNVNIDAYWDPAGYLAEESVSHAARVQAAVNAGIDLSKFGQLSEAFASFVCTQVNLVA